MTKIVENVKFGAEVVKCSLKKGNIVFLTIVEVLFGCLKYCELNLY